MPKGKRGGYGKREDFSDYNDKKTKLGILSEEVMSYYRNVSSSLDNGFEDESTKDNFLTNVYTTLKEEGITVSQNQTVSRILEVLFSHSKAQHMLDLFCSFCDQLTIVAFDRFASHVFQSLIQYLPAIYESDCKDSNTFQQKNIHTSTQQLCKFMESHMRDIMTHTYASHVLRALLEALGGVRVNDEIIRSRVSRSQRRDDGAELSIKPISKKLSQDFQSSFTALKEKLLYLCNYEDHLMDPNYCPVLQSVLLIVHKTSPDEYESLVDTITQKTLVVPETEETDTEDVSKKLPDVVQNEVGSYLVELLISLASISQLQQLYTKLFSKRLIYFIVHPIANYVLQKLLSVVKDEKMMKELLDDISQYIEDILAVNHVGIVTKLAEACRRTGFGEEDFLRALMKAFHCSESEERQIKLAPLLASMQTYEVFFHLQDSTGETASQAHSAKCILKTVNIHGSLLLQQLLQFSHPKLVVFSLLDLTPTELAGLACDKCGSHVIDVFFQSPTVLDKNKTTCLKKMEAVCVNIACNRNGSRCLENIWKGSSVKRRIMMAEMLAKSQDRIESDQWGRFLYRNFALAKFSQRRKEWMEIQGASTKRQMLLQDILLGKGSKKQRQKHQKSLKEAENSQFEQPLSELQGGKSSQKRTNVSLDESDVSATATVEGHWTPEKSSKRKRKLDRDIPTERTEPAIEKEVEELPQKKKRKRNKEKKRMMRSVESTQEVEPDNSETALVKSNSSKSKKEKHKTKEASALLDFATEKKKKLKLPVDDENKLNTDCSAPSKSKHKKKKQKYEKKRKLKTLKIKS